MLTEPGSRVEQLDEELAELAVEGYWKSVGTLPRAPTPKGEPWLWRWRDIYPKLFDASAVIDLEAGAERRSLRLCTPGLSWKTTTETLTAAIQMVMPGETARAHRHSPAALRFVIQGTGGGYTTVNGERYGMEVSDLILTPQDSWHDHGNRSQEPVVWLDVLDVPIVRFLNAVFSDPFTQPVQDVLHPEGFTRRMNGFARPDRQQYSGPGGGHFHYKGSESIGVLRELPEMDADAFDGVTLSYLNPVDNGPTMPTIQCRLHRLLAERSTTRHRHTWNTIYHVVEGRGETVVGGKTLAWEAHDTFSLPSWHWHEHRTTAAGDAILFSITDEPILRALRLDRAESAEQ